MSKDKITEDYIIGEVIIKYPETFYVLAEHGLGCFACHSAGSETIKDVAKVHGINLKKLLQELNACISKKQKQE